MGQTGKGVISQDDLMHRLVQAKKVINKVESGNFEKGNIDENILRSDPEELSKNYTPKQNNQSGHNVNKIMESKLPEAIKRAMIDNPISQIALTDSLDMNFVEKTRRLMESEGVSKKPSTQKQNTVQYESNDLIQQLTPIIENIVRKTIDDVMDRKLTQILTAQQTMSLNENLVLKVGDSIFKGKITGVNKAK